MDQTGTARPDAAWFVSDTTIADFVSGCPNTLTGITAGQVTLTATVGNISGQTTATVLPGSSLSAGTVLSSATPVSGFAAQRIVQAVPTANGPDLYSIETDGSGNYLIRAFHSDGEQMWQNSLTQTVGAGFSVSAALADNSGGILALSGTSIVDLNGQTGSLNWQYQGSGNLSLDVAVGPDGTIYDVEEQPNSGTTNVLDSINGNTGALLSQTSLPTSSYFLYNIDCFPNDSGGDYFPGLFGPLIVGPDGTVSIGVESSQYSYTYPSCSGAGGGATYAENLSLLQLSPSGGTRLLALASFSQVENEEQSNTSRSSRDLAGRFLTRIDAYRN